jgi:hypothetical protein
VTTDAKAIIAMTDVRTLTDDDLAHATAEGKRAA